MKKTLFTLLLLIFLAACAPLEPVAILPAPTQPVTKATQPTPEAALPAESDPPAPTLPANQQDSPLQENSAEPEPASLTAEEPQIPGTAEIAILRPGQYSRLVSPIRVIASFSNQTDLHTFITLYGEDGRTLAERKFEILPYDDPVNGNVITDLEFTIEGLNEVGRLEFKVYDQFGRLRALNSVNLILLSRGSADRNYAPEDGERILQQIPFPGQIEVKGGRLFLSGLVQFTPTIQTGDKQPLTIHLVDERGEIVAEGRAPVVLSPGSLIGQYVAEIEYQVTAPTAVLLSISIIEGRSQTPAYVRTFPLTLLP